MQHAVGERLERSSVIRVSEHVQILHRLRGEFRGQELGLFDAVAGPNAFQRRSHVAGLGKTPDDQSRQVGMLVESEENGRRGETQVEIRRRRLSQRLVRGDEVQQVVDELEGDPDVTTVLREKV